MPAVSILLPVYNAESTLAAAIASLRAQTFRDWELLILDDGSTDNSVRVAHVAAGGDGRVRVIQNPHLGLVATLNTGLGLARGAFIARQDADDTSHPRRLERQIETLRIHSDVDVVSCLVEHTSGGLPSEGYAKYCAWLNSICLPNEIRLASFIESPLAHPTVLFRRELINKYGLYKDGPFPEDYELWLRWLDAGVQMIKVPEVLYTWNDSETRLSRTDPRYKAQAFAELKAQSLARWLVQHNSQYPDIVVWGAGPRSRKRARFLTAFGSCRIRAYIDVNPELRGKLFGGAPVVMMEEIGSLGECFILSYVGNRGRGAEVREYLIGLGRVEARDFLICS